MMDTFLPYHCPVFRTDHLLEPCTKNLARVEALKEAKQHVGPLERCLECKGTLLQYLREGFKIIPVPIFIKGVDRKEPEMRQLSLEKIAEGRAAAQRLVESYKLGKKLPKIDDISGMDPNFTGKLSTEELQLPKFPITEADKYPKQEEPVPIAKISEKEAVKLGIVPPEPFATDRSVLRYCKTHPEMPQKQDKLGRWMGMCAECLSIRGRECGIQNAARGISAPPMAIPLNLPKYAELKGWLKDQAEEHEQTLQGAIMYILKMAWRQGQP